MESDGGGIPQKTPVIPAKAGIYSGRLILEFRKFYAKIKFEIPAHFSTKKRRERGDLSAKMDSRFRGNDGGEAGIRRRKSGGGGRRNSEKNGGIRRKKSPVIPPENKKKPPSFPRKRESILRNKTANSPRFSTKKQRERGNLSVKMDSRVRGNDSGEGGNLSARIGRRRRRKSDSGGGNSDLHRNGKSWKLGKKNFPFRRTPESLQEIPIYIGMVKKRRERGNKSGDF